MTDPKSIAAKCQLMASKAGNADDRKYWAAMERFWLSKSENAKDADLKDAVKV